MSDYWRLAEAASGEDVACRDPSCGGRAEPERDGEHQYFECIECGMTFGYERVSTDTETNTCAIGVPNEIRQRAMGTPQAVPVTLTKRKKD